MKVIHELDALSNKDNDIYYNLQIKSCNRKIYLSLVETYYSQMISVLLKYNVILALGIGVTAIYFVKSNIFFLYKQSNAV